MMQAGMGDNRAIALSAGVASAVVAMVLVGLKLWAFGQTGALTVAASLADSAMDVMMSLAALAALIYAARPADEDHTFGHTSVEDLASLGQSLLILVSAGVIAGAAVLRLIGPDRGDMGLRAEAAGLVVMALSIVLTLALVIWQGYVARKTANRVIAADRLHYLGDLLPNIGAIVALVASKYWDIGAIDAVVALAAAGILAFGALRIGKGAWDALMDRRADPAIIADIAAVTAAWPGVYGFHDLKTRMAGSRIFVNLHIELDGAQSLSAAHDIGAGLRRAILARHPQCDVMIHKDVHQRPQ
jgi:ferrous-iron efflux pump FieF